METSEPTPPVKIDPETLIKEESKNKLDEAQAKIEEARRKMEEKIKAKELKKEQEAAAAPKEEEVDDNVDPLDAFIMSVNEEVKKINQTDRKRTTGSEATAAVGADVQQADGQQAVGYLLIRIMRVFFQ